MFVVFLSAPCSHGFMDELNAENTEGVFVETEEGADASDSLKGSGKEYTPTYDSDNKAVIAIKFKPREGTIGLGEFNFTTKGKLTVGIVVLSPEDDQLASEEVSLPIVWTSCFWMCVTRANVFDFGVDI